MTNSSREGFLKRNRAEALQSFLKEFERYYKLGHGVALDDLVMFCDEFARPLPKWAIAELAQQARNRSRGVKQKKKMGRHASHRTTQQQYAFDIGCFKRVLDLHHKKVPWGQIYKTVADEFHVEPEVVRKIYARTKKRLKTIVEDFYWSPSYDDSGL